MTFKSGLLDRVALRVGIHREDNFIGFTNASVEFKNFAYGEWHASQCTLSNNNFVIRKYLFEKRVIIRCQNCMRLNLLHSVYFFVYFFLFTLIIIFKDFV